MCKNEIGELDDHVAELLGRLDVGLPNGLDGRGDHLEEEELALTLKLVDSFARHGLFLESVVDRGSLSRTRRSDHINIVLLLNNTRKEL